MLSTTPLSITHARTPGGPVLVLAGEADVSNFRVLAEELFDAMAAGHQLILDAGALSYLDSMALRSLVQAARVLRDRGGKMVLMRPQPAVLKILEITGAITMMAVQA